MKFRNVLPEFYEEVQTMLVQANRNDLAAQLSDLEITKRCPCTEIGCASFTVKGGSQPDSFELVAPKQGVYTSSIALKNAKGKMTLGLDQLGRITFFEVRDRPDVRKKLFRRR